MTKKLWEIEHPYYCTESYYYTRTPTKGWGAPQKYSTFGEYLKEWEDPDLDMNFVFRWDWQRLTPEKFEDEGFDEVTDASLNSEGNFSELKLFLMMQRKGCKKIITIQKMEDSDNDAVIKHLLPKWENMKATWAGISEIEETP